MYGIRRPARHEPTNAGNPLVTERCSRTIDLEAAIAESAQGDLFADDPKEASRLAFARLFQKTRAARKGKRRSQALHGEHPPQAQVTWLTK